jgi:hypothetical protein
MQVRKRRERERKRIGLYMNLKKIKWMTNTQIRWERNSRICKMR